MDAIISTLHVIVCIFLVAVVLLQRGKGAQVGAVFGGGAGASPARGNIPTSLANVTVANMTRALSDAVSADGILVNMINPGMTNTQRARDILHNLESGEFDAQGRPRLAEGDAAAGPVDQLTLFTGVGAAPVPGPDAASAIGPDAGASSASGPDVASPLASVG